MFECKRCQIKKANKRDLFITHGFCLCVDCLFVKIKEDFKKLDEQIKF